MLYAIWTPHFLNSFFNEKMALIFIGILVGATRILLSVFEATDQTCSGIIWTEHISFWAAFGGLVLKSSKVRQIRSTLNGEDATISNHPYTRDDSRRFLSERWGLVDAPDLKRDQSAIEPSVPVTARSDIPSNESDPLLKSIDNQSIGSHQTTGSAGFRRRVSDSGVVPIDIRDDGIVNLTKNQQVSYASETEFSSTQGELANHTSLCKQVSSTSKLSQNTSIEYTSLEYTSQTSVTGSRIESMSPSANQRTSLQEQLKIRQIYDTQNANDIYDSSRSDAIDSVGFGRNNREIAELYGLHRVPDWVKTLIQQDTDNYLLQRLFVPGLSLLIICMILIQVVGHPYATTVYTYSGAQGYAIEICSFEHIQVHELVLIIEFLFIIIGVRYCFFARYREGALETEVKYLFRAVLVFAFLWLVVIAVTWDFPAEFNTISANQYAQLTFVISVLFTVTLIFTLITVIFIVFQRYWVLSRLPVHNAMAENLPPRLVMEAIVRYPETITKRDLDGLTAYDWAMSTAKTTTVLSYSYFAIVRTIVEESLPFDPTHPLLPDRDPKIHRYFWSSLVQSDSNCGVVEYILESFPDKQVISKLIHSTDRSGRKAIDLASPMCKMIIQESTYFLKLYEIESLDHAHYESCTSIVLFANNRQLESKPVVLKFMKYKEQLESEIDARFLGKFDPYYVVPVLNACRASVDEFFYQELCKWNLGEFLYYVELERGSRSLKAIISKEALTESRIRRMIKEVVSAVAHIHSRGYSHNDIRPSNFIRRYDTKQLSLIDLKFASQLARDANNNNILSKFRSYFFSSSESSSPPSSTTATPAPTKSVAQASDSPYTWSSGYLSPEVAEKNLNFDFQRFFGKLELGLGRNPWSMQTATKDTNNAESFLRSSRKKRRSSSLLSISSVFTDRNKTQVKSPMNFYDVKMGSRRLLPTDRHYNEAPLLVEIRFHHRKSLHKHEEEEAKTALLQEDSANKIESISSDVDICNQESTTDSAEFLSQIRVPVGCTALDVWSIGAVLYELIVDAPLFLCSKDDNILHRSDMELLVEWSDNTKVHKLSVVADPLARDLLSKLLTKDPLKRPALSEVLEHEYFKQLDPRSLKFHPNNLLANISEPVYDFYISHRDTDPDTLIVDKIYSTLTEAGYSVSLGLRDDPELVSRLNSDSDRCSIIFKKMLQSKTIVLIFSRTGMRNNYYDKFNLELLESSSACDMLLFEHKAAVELQVMINSKNIIPVFIGPVHLSSVVDHSIETDSLIATTTNDSFISKYLFHNSSDLNDSCYPILRDIVIQSVEQQYYRCVDDFGYDAGDSDTSKNLSINQILTRSGGQPNRIFLEGDMTSAIQLLLHDIKKM